MYPSRLAIFSVWACLFLQGAFPTPCPFGEILRTSLCSWGFPIQLSLSGFFRRRLRSCRQIFSHCQIPRGMLRIFFRPYLSEVFAIVARLFIIWVNLRAFSAQLGLRVRSNLLVVTSCCRVASSIWSLLGGGALVGSFWYRGFLLMKGLQNFHWDYFSLVSDIPGSLLPAFCLCCPLTKKI